MAAVYLKRERDGDESSVESDRTLSQRPCGRQDVKKAFSYLDSLKMRKAGLLDKVKIGYLMWTTGGDEAAITYCECHNIKHVTESYRRDFKLNLHRNLSKIKKRGRRNNNINDAEQHEDPPAQGSVAEEAEVEGNDDAADGEGRGDSDADVAIKAEWQDSGVGTSQPWRSVASKAVGPSQPQPERRRRLRRT